MRRVSLWLVWMLAVPALAQEVRTGTAAFGDWRADAPGVVRRILPADLPPPGATASAARFPTIVARPAGALPAVPAGFRVTVFAPGLDRPRRLAVAPNGDVLVAESEAGRIRLLRAPPGADAAVQSTEFATGLRLPYGLAFWPPGPQPTLLYVGEGDRVVRFPYATGAMQAAGPAQTV